MVTKEELELWKTGASGYASTDLYDHVIKNSSIQQQYTLSLQGGSILSHTLVVLAMHLMKGC